MRWTIGVLTVILIYVATPAGTKVNVVCGGVDAVMKIGGWGVDKAVEMNAEMNTNLDEYIGGNKLNVYASKAAMACREKMRRVVAYTDGLDPAIVASKVETVGKRAISETTTVVKKLQAN